MTDLASYLTQFSFWLTKTLFSDVALGGIFLAGNSLAYRKSIKFHSRYKILSVKVTIIDTQETERWRLTDYEQSLLKVIAKMFCLGRAMEHFSTRRLGFRNYIDPLVKHV